MKRRSKRHEELALRLKWRTVSYQATSDLVDGDSGAENDVAPKVDPHTHEELEQQKQQQREDAYLGTTAPPESEWEEFIENGQSGWRNQVTLEVAFEKPDELKTEAERARDQARKRMQKAKERRRPR